MINIRAAKDYCCEDISKVENYDKAINDNTQTWHLHHRRETVYSAKDLIEIGEYYNRPAIELIFLTPKEHKALHNTLFFKDRKSTFSGKHHSEETKQKMRKSHKDKRKGKNNPAHNRHWYNDGIKNVFAKECPNGFVKGRLIMYT